MATLKSTNPWKYQDALSYSQAVRWDAAAEVMQISGQASVDEEGHPVHAGDMCAQIVQTMDNLSAVLEKAEMSWANVSKLVIYCTDPQAFVEHYAAYAERLDTRACAPAATLLGVSALIYPELMVEIEATAVR